MSVLEFEREYFIHTSMVGKNDVIRPAALLDLFQDTAAIHATKLGVGFDDLLKLNLYWVVSFIEYELIKPFKSFDNVKVKTWPHQKNRLEFNREFEINDLDNNLLAKCISSWFVIDTKERKLQRGDNVLFNGDFKTETNFAGFRRKKLGVKKDNPDYEWDYVVQRTDLDHNGHMNNAKYPDIIFNGRIDERDICKFRISYVHESLLGQTIHVTYYKTSDNINSYVGTINGVTCFEIETEVTD